jgi:hypothetical protein
VNSAPALTPDQRSLLLQYMLPTALARITAALSVDPVEGPLRASRQCQSRFRIGDLIGKCASYSSDLPLCNTLPNVVIPENLLGSNCTDYSNVCCRDMLHRDPMCFPSSLKAVAAACLVLGWASRLPHI